MNHLLFSSEPIKGENVWQEMQAGSILATDLDMRMTYGRSEGSKGLRFLASFQFYVLILAVGLIGASVEAKSFEFKNWDYESPYYLDGEWKYLESQIEHEKLTPSTFESWQSVRLPFERKLNGAKRFDAYFAVQLKDLTVGRALGFFVPQLFTAGSLFVYDQGLAKISQVGEILPDGAITASFLEQRVEYTPRSKDIWLIIQLANEYHHVSGVRDLVVVLPIDELYSHRNVPVLLRVSIFGVLLIFGIYHLGLFYQRPSAKKFVVGIELLSDFFLACHHT